MKFFKTFLILALMLSISDAFGLAYNRNFRDMKLPTQKLIEFQEIDNPLLADVDKVLVDTVSSATLVTTVTTFDGQPDVARALGITPTGTTADVAAMSITVTGTNYNGATITETFAFAANASTVTVGVKAFKTVTIVSIPAQDGAAATFDVGILDVLGLKKCMAGSFVVQTMFDNAKETTFPTVVYDIDEVEKNTIDINGTLDGAKDLDVLFIQNFAASCYP